MLQLLALLSHSKEVGLHLCGSCPSVLMIVQAHKIQTSSRGSKDVAIIYISFQAALIECVSSIYLP